MTIREALTRAAGQLAANPHLQPTALADAILLLLHTLHIERATLLAHPERVLDRGAQAAYQALLNRRLAFEPIQYILGEQEFYGHALRVTPAVLIPRPETELLVEAVLARLPHDRPVQLVDVGTGSGAIAIALAHALPLAAVTAIDLSAAALAVASDNVARHHLDARVRLLHSDLLDSLPHPPLYHAIISNPPYVPSGDEQSLHPQVRDFEPAQALFAGSDGLAVYRRLIPQAYEALQPGGLLALEFGYGQGDSLPRLLASWSALELLPDLQQIPRVLLARRPLHS